VPLQLRAFSDFTYDDPAKRIVTDPTEFQTMLNFLMTRDRIVFDHETTGLAWHQGCKSIGLGLGGWHDNGQLMAYYVPYRHRTGQQQLDINLISPGIKELFEDQRRMTIAHNWKFDAHFNRAEGWGLPGPAYDTMIGARIWDENRNVALEDAAALDLKMGDAAYVGKRLLTDEVKRLASNQGLPYKRYLSTKGYSEVDIILCGFYCCTDVTLTGGLHSFYEHSQLSSIYSRIWNTETRLVKVITEMEMHGLPVDTEYLHQLEVNCVLERDRLRDQMSKYLRWPEFNPGSDADARLALFGYLKLTPIKRTKEGELSVDREVLEYYEGAHAFCKWLLDWRVADKIITSYTFSLVGKLGEDRYVHGNMQQVGTITGRLSCRDPNYQQMPNESDERAVKATGKKLEEGGLDPWSIRRAFVMRPGHVRIFADYSQIELRVLAYYSKDPIMVEAYLTGQDLHDRTSKEVEVTRRIAKVIAFGLAYCMTDVGLSRQAKLPIEDAKKFLARFFERYPGILNFRHRLWAAMRANGNSFYNLFGRRRHVPLLSSIDSYNRGRGERQGIASLIQGSAAELTKESIVRLDDAYAAANLDAKIVNTMHDEIQIDVPQEQLIETAQITKTEMERYPEFDPIPIIVDIEWSDKTWADKKSLEGV
jgi:DNA polymerase-1